jgi:hypothetical protein
MSSQATGTGGRNPRRHLAERDRQIRIAGIPRRSRDTLVIGEAARFTGPRVGGGLGWSRRGHGLAVPRLFVAGYTTRDEIDRLLTALARELDAEHGQQDE